MTGVIVTGNAIRLYRLLALRGAIKLEARGLKMSRGRSATASAKAEFGVKGSRDRVLARIEEEIEKALTQIGSGDLRGF